MTIKELFDSMADAIQKVSDAQENLVAKQADAKVKWDEIQAGVEAAAKELSDAKAEYESLKAKYHTLNQTLGLGQSE